MSEQGLDKEKLSRMCVMHMLFNQRPCLYKYLSDISQTDIAQVVGEAIPGDCLLLYYLHPQRAIEMMTSVLFNTNTKAMSCCIESAKKAGMDALQVCEICAVAENTLKRHQKQFHDEQGEEEEVQARRREERYIQVGFIRDIAHFKIPVTAYADDNEEPDAHAKICDSYGEIILHKFVGLVHVLTPHFMRSQFMRHYAVSMNPDAVQCTMWTRCHVSLHSVVSAHKVKQCYTVDVPKRLFDVLTEHQMPRSVRVFYNHMSTLESLLSVATHVFQSWGPPESNNNVCTLARDWIYTNVYKEQVRRSMYVESTEFQASVDYYL